MNISTFEEDLLERQKFAKEFEKYIDTECDFVEGSLVVALSSKYGFGKTTFLKMWQSYMTKSTEKDEHRLAVYLNAWESDYIGDPLYAIVSALAEAVRDNGDNPDKLLEAVKDLGWFTTAIGAQFVNKFTGIDPVAAGELAEKKKEERNEHSSGISDAFTVFENRKSSMISLKNIIGKIVQSTSNKTIFLVDELDRCRPDYAITYLETIKHLFDTSGAVFILAADRQQLENSAKKAFGNNLDFDEYYRKFIHREVLLPPVSQVGYSNIAKKYVDYYLESEGARFCFINMDHHRTNEIVQLIASLELSPRQIQEVFRTLGHLSETSEEKKGELLWCLGVGSIAMAAFKIGAPKIFNSLGNQELDPAEAATFIKDVIAESDPNWWFTLFYTGGGLETVEGENAESVYIRGGLSENDENRRFSDEFAQWRSGWGHSRRNGFAEIHDKLQQLSRWD